LEKKLATSFKKLEDQRQALLNQLAALSAEKLLYAPAGKWSIAQILSHVLTSEKMSVGYMYKKTLGIETLPDSGVRQSVLSVVLKISQRVPLKYKAPKIVAENTPEAMPLPVLTKQWDEVRNNLKGLLERIDSKHQNRLIFKHPVAGKFNAAQAVDFMYEHLNHHLPQIKRLLASS
jgi:uncharacterized damage-inducible protein DinB